MELHAVVRPIPVPKRHHHPAGVLDLSVRRGLVRRNPAAVAATPLRPRARYQTLRQRRRVHRQRVIPSHHERSAFPAFPLGTPLGTPCLHRPSSRGDPGEERGVVVDEDVKTAVHRHGGPADDAAVRSRQRLVPEAHAEHRDVHRVR